MNIEELEYNDVIKLIIKEFKGVPNVNTGNGMFTDNYKYNFKYILENEILNFRIPIKSKNNRYILEFIDKKYLTKTYSLIDKETNKEVFITNRWLENYGIEECYLSKPIQETIYIKNEIIQNKR